MLAEARAEAEDFEVIGIDEGQFFGKPSRADNSPLCVVTFTPEPWLGDLVEFSEDMANQGTSKRWHHTHHMGDVMVAIIVVIVVIVVVMRRLLATIDFTNGTLQGS